MAEGTVAERTKGREWAISRARDLAVQLDMTHFAFELDGQWVVSAGLHRRSQSGAVYVVCSPEGACTVVPR